MTLLNGYKTPPAKELELGDSGLSPPMWPQSHTRSLSFPSPNLCQKSSSNNNVSNSHSHEDEGKTLYEDFVQEQRIISTNKNEITAGGSDIARKEEQGSNSNISFAFASNSAASKSTTTTSGLALAKIKADDVDEIESLSLKKRFKDQAEEFIPQK